MIVPAPIVASTRGLRIACASEPPRLASTESTTPTARASAAAFIAATSETAPVTLTLLLPTVAWVIGFPVAPGCTNACASAPAPARIPPASAVALADVFAVESATSESEPAEATSRSRCARVEPS